MNKQDKTNMFQMLIDLKDFETQFKQVTNYDEETEIIKNMLSVMFYGQHYIDKGLNIVKESED